MGKYIAMIGLEMHCEISETKSKVFSPARNGAENSYKDIPNSNVRPLDMGFPGTLPVVNKEAVKMALKTSMILNCQQPEYMYFERKNYYYPDMPKNFQITQETKPIPVGIYGEFEYYCGEEKKKTLRAIVGCKADPRNLTLGERTGACMRAHGHAHSLFTFTNTDPRGFHIIFEDPVDGTFISRVSGFRNGNTVFLNQLRYSVDTEKYSNFDVIEACRAIASELIEKSKNSPMPIENVVCSPCYSLEGAETQTLSEYEIGRDVYSGYKDVSQNAVVLATTGENGIAVPLKLNPEQPLYKSCRLPIRYYTYPNIDNKEKILIQRINLLGKCKESSNNEYYKYADFDFEILETDFVYIILGQDFYVALDNQGKIINNIISEEEEAKKEYEGALEKISEYKDRMLGGTNNARSL